MEYGSHKIECRKASHRTTEMTINVDPNTLGPIALESPTPIYGTLAITSTPIGADIYVDNKLVGKSPATLETLVGIRNVSIRKSGHNTVNKNIDIREAQTSHIDITLENIIPITVLSSPSASLYIDDKLVGTTPWTGSVIAGNHKFHLQSVGFNGIEETIHINEPNKQYLFSLKRRYYYDNSFIVGAEVMSGFKDVSVGGYIGAYMRGFYIEGFAQKGIKASEPIFWNALQTDNEPVKYTYSPLVCGGKLGYGFIAGNRIRITPIIGAGVTLLKGTPVDGNTSTFDPSSCSAIFASGGAKFSCALSSCVELNIIPEYYYSLSKTNIYKALYDISPMVKNWSDGVKISIGLGLFF